MGLPTSIPLDTKNSPPGLFFVELIQIKQRTSLLAVNNSLRLAHQLLQPRLAPRAPDMHGFHDLSLLLVANLHPRRPANRLKLSNIRHNSILAHLFHDFFHKNHKNFATLLLMFSKRAT